MLPWTCSITPFLLIRILAVVGFAGFGFGNETEEEKFQELEVIIETFNDIGIPVVEDNGDDSDQKTITCSNQRFSNTDYNGLGTTTGCSEFVQGEYNPDNSTEQSKEGTGGTYGTKNGDVLL